MIDPEVRASCNRLQQLLEKQDQLLDELRENAQRYQATREQSHACSREFQEMVRFLLDRTYRQRSLSPNTAPEDFPEAATFRLWSSK